jgi:RimJ/RimL family protein N-acetyltransferase
VGLDVPGIDCVEIRCDPLNEASRRVPMKLGYRFREILVGDRQTPDGAPRDTVVFEITHAEGIVDTLQEQID